MDRATFFTPNTYFAVACTAFSILAVSTIWRNQQPTASAKGKAPAEAHRSRTTTRVPVDSVLTDDRSSAFQQTTPRYSLSTIETLLTKCAQIVDSLRSEPQMAVACTSLLSELSLLTTAVCRLQNVLDHSEERLFRQPGLSACFTAASSSISSIFAALEEDLKSGRIPQTKYLDSVRQLRDQRSTLDFLTQSLDRENLPPTPPSESSVAGALRNDHSVLLAAFEPSTGLTPSADARSWIEPPPEYSPPSNSAVIVAAEKSEEKQAVQSPPDAQTEQEDEVFDTDALYNAVTNDERDLVADLLEHGASADEAIGELQRTALHQAAHLNHLRCLAILLQHGARMSVEDAKGDTPLHLAAWAGHCEALSALLAHGADVDWLSGRDGYSPLWCAISAYHIDAARLLLKHGARVSLRSAAGNGLLPLHQAAVTGQSAMCELLLERGAQVDTVDDDRNTALHYGAASGSLPSVQVLLRHGADVTAAQRQGLTPAHWAAHKGHTEVLQLLLAYGAPVNAVANEGATPLHLAANRGHLAATRLLLEKGASRTLKAEWDGCEGTPVQMAKAKGQNRVAKSITSWT